MRWSERGEVRGMATEKAVTGDVDWASIATTGGRRTAHEFVKDSLRRAILRGDLSGGSRLIQADLATMLNVSTTPVREALRDLATEGFITLDRHRGGVVRELNWSEMEEIRSDPPSARAAGGPPRGREDH